MEKVKNILRRRGRLLCRSESGQSLVEVTVIGYLFVVLLVGAVEFGQVAYDSIEISNAALAGAQYGSLSSVNAGNPTGVQNAALAAAPDIGGLQVTSSRTCVCSDGSVPQPGETCSIGICSASNVEAEVIVNTSATITPGIKLPGFNSFTLQAQAIQKCVQTAGL